MDSGRMITKTGRVCAKCGTTVFADAPHGFCSVCLFLTGLGSLDEENDEAPEAKRIQMEFGDYELLEEIGRGGQGVVYRARQKSLNRTVALKVIGLGHWSSTPHLKRFRHEAEAAASLEHPQIVPIYEIGERDGSCYFSMKFVEGGQLDEVVRREPMSTRRAAELLVKIARTVQFAHEHGILHRDIKPGNILLDRQGEPHLTDFGLARLIEQESTVTNSFDVLGTPSYMAPEQAAGHAKELTATADVYALGAVFYQMLTGQPPFAGGTTYETIRLVMETEPRNPRLWNPRVDVDLATICSKCLEKDPKKRYETAEALAKDVERWLRHEPIRARRAGVITRSRKWVRRNPVLAAVTPLVAALVAIVAVLFWRNAAVQPPTTGVAVLPFENLSEDKDTAFFADGVQDDILTKLAKIADLKVISRTSVMEYRGARNIRQIGDALRVSHVLEGSVRRNAGRIHFNAQLIDTRTDTHVWAEEYDRDVNDMFAIQSEVAQKVAAQLQARIAPAQLAQIERKPTANLEAYEAYLRGLAHARAAYDPSESDKAEALRNFREAVRLDPSFAEAWSRLSRQLSFTYFRETNRSPATLAAAREAARNAYELQPGSAEANLAQGYLLYYGEKNYDEATRWLEKARELAPGDSEIYEALGRISRRMGKWRESADYFQRAVELSPRDARLLEGQLLTLHELRDYPAMLKASEALLAIDPDNKWALSYEISAYQDSGDLKTAAKLLPQQIESDRMLLLSQISQWLYERRYDEAIKALTAALVEARKPDLWFERQEYLSHLALVYHAAGKTPEAQETARALKETLNIDPKSEAAIYDCARLAEAYAFLGDKEQAIATLQPLKTEKDVVVAADFPDVMAEIGALTSDKEMALTYLAVAARTPSYSGPSYGDLKFSPLWDGLRGDPRFEQGRRLTRSKIMSGSARASCANASPARTFGVSPKQY